MNCNSFFYILIMKLIFVYNAKSGILNKSFDMAHKIINPSTYSCDLCTLTHGNFFEKEIWKRFKKNLDIDIEFMYKNQFYEKYSNMSEQDFPIILKQEKDVVSVLFDSKEITSLESVEELIFKLKERVLVMKS